MSWFKRDSPFRSSVKEKFASGIAAMTGSSANTNVPVEHDADACFDSFKNHWHQAWKMMCHRPPQMILSEQIDFVENHLDQLLLLLLNELGRADTSIGPLLDLVLTDDILNKRLTWSLELNGEFVNKLKLKQLKLYETLIIHSKQEVLVHKPVLQPLLRLLGTCTERSPVEFEVPLVILLNQLCVSLAHNATLLDFFFSANLDQGPGNFLIFSLLIPFVHREGEIGQLARDSLLLCMALSRKNHGIGVYIAKHPSFCPVLATGLSGLYSLLPRKLTIEAEDWHRFTPDDLCDMQELKMFINSLEFCNAVIQVAHPLVQDQLLEYLYQGFLLPVLVPALRPSVQQFCVLELMTATAYLDLFLRTITEPSLLRVFLKAILSKCFAEEPPVITDLIQRIASPHPLCVVTLALFHTLLSLNCEDVMLELVFKYLIGCTHIMVSQRCRVREVDMFGKTAEKFLSLAPACCVPLCDVDQEDSSNFGAPSEHGNRMLPGTLPRTVGRRRRSPSSASYAPGDFRDLSLGHTTTTTTLQPSSFLDYLMDARRTVTSCLVACHSWTWPYDGEQPPPHGTLIISPSNVFLAKNGVPLSKDASPCLDDRYESNVDADRLSSKENCEFGDQCIAKEQKNSRDGPKHDELKSKDHTTLQDARFPSFKGHEIIHDVRIRPSHLSYMNNISSSGPNSPADGFGSPDLGPFLSNLLTKLENMMTNSIYENLQLTGVIARLACYPQPLLRSFLLNHSLVFQPSVRSLLQVLGRLKQKLDSFFYTVENVDDLMLRARKFFAFRDKKIFLDNGKKPSTLSDRRSSTPEGFNKVETKRRSLTERIFRRSPLNSDREKINSKFSNLLDSIPNNTGYRYVKGNSSDFPDGKLETLRLKNAVLCMVVMEEFLKELSAISMEHAVVWEEESELEFLWKF